MKYIENQLQANMVKVEDTNNNFVSDNVEDALNEINIKIDSLSPGGSGTNFSVLYDEVNEELTITSVTENNIVYDENTNERVIYAANIGDSRVLFYSNGVVSRLSYVIEFL